MSAMDSTLPAEQPTLRDRFAMAALAGMFGSGEWEESTPDQCAKWAYYVADAMLDARES